MSFPVFDLHCDTASVLMGRDFRGEGKLNKNTGHIDLERAKNFGLPVRTVVHGDSLSANIAAASILAKVSRDNLMLEMAEQYPQYGFEIHKGYGTKAHYEAIMQNGPCAIHRMTFLKKLYGTK